MHVKFSANFLLRAHLRFHNQFLIVNLGVFQLPLSFAVNLIEDFPRVTTDDLARKSDDVVAYTFGFD